MIERHEKLLIVSLVVLALAVQLPNVLVYGVGYDPAQVLYLAWDFIDEGIFPVHGILNSLGAYNPPFFVWLYLLPMMLTRDHGWVLTLPALSLHILAILILYRLGRRYFNPGLGLAAAALYAFSPLGLYFGNSSWAQGLLSPLYVLMVLFMSEWLLECKSWYVALLLPFSSLDDRHSLGRRTCVRGGNACGFAFSNQAAPHTDIRGRVYLLALMGAISWL